MKRTLLTAVIFCLSVPALAVQHLPDPVKGGNKWKITFYYDLTPQHEQWNSQTLCFYFISSNGTHDQYLWVSDSFPDWNGHANQEGDQVFMEGDYNSDVGHTAMQWELVTFVERTLGAGHYQRWHEDGEFGRANTWHNITMERVGKCEIQDPYEAIKRYMQIPYPKDENGNPMLDPSGIVVE